MASARASASPLGTSTPVSPSLTMAVDATDAARHDRTPAAMACRIDRPSPSWNVGSTNRSMLAMLRTSVEVLGKR